MATRPSLMSRPSSVMAAKKIIVLISGGNQGIGLEIVRSLAQLPNYQVLMGCRDTAKGEDAVAAIGAPHNVNPIQLDITDDKSLEHCYLTIEQMFGKLDLLINNAATQGQDLPENRTQRQKWERIFSVNVISHALITEKLAPLLEKSSSPKVIFVTSRLGSIETLIDRPETRLPIPDYGSSKAAINYITVCYAKKYPRWRVNAVCPGLRATGMTGAKLDENTDPKLGAKRVTEIAKQGPDGDTATYSNAEGLIPW